MGVELGKVLAKNILAQLDKPDDVKNHDSSVCVLDFDLPFDWGLISAPCDTDHRSHPLLPEVQEGVRRVGSIRRCSILASWFWRLEG